MKRILTPTVAACAMAALCAPAAAQSDAKQAIWHFTNAWISDYSQHNAAGCAARWAAGGDLMDATGRMHRGRSQIQEYIQSTYRMSPRIQFVNADVAVTVIKPDVALVDVSGTLTNVSKPDGATWPPLKNIVSSVLVRAGGQWQIRSARWMLPVQPTTHPR